jgi:hypothetical protein
MSGIFGASHLFFSGKSDFYEYLVNKSLRFDDASTSKLTRTLGSSGDRKTWTLSGWFKRGDLPNDFPIILASYVTTQNYGIIRFDTDGRINIVSKIADVNGINISTNAVFRDVGSWYNIVVAIDTTQATSSDRVKIYINGVQITSFFTATYPSQNYSTIFNYNILHLFGNSGFSPPRNYDGYMAQIHFVDGQQLNPTSFGETKSGVWIPIEYTGSYGNNGFKLEFEDSSDIGKDTSGNNPANDFTATALDSHDVVIDSPTLNYPTFQSTDLGEANLTLSQGSLKVANSSTSSNYNAVSTMAMPNSGKWYAEFGFPTRTGGTGHLLQVGIVEASKSAREIGDSSMLTASSVAFNSTGILMTDSSTSSDGYYSDGSQETAFDAVVTTSSIISIAIDFDNGGLWAAINGTWVNGATLSEIVAGTTTNAATVTSNTDGWRFLVVPRNVSQLIANFGQNGTFDGNTGSGNYSDANGHGNFKYPVPSSYLALNADNLPEPSITPLNDELPEDYFEPNTWTGNGTSQSRSDYEFSPDWVWIKERTSTSSHMIYDTIRGTDLFLQSNSLVKDTTSTVNLTSFDSNGFSLGSGGSTNQNGQDYVGWAWKAGGTPTATNSAGAGNVPTSGSVMINGVASTVALAGTNPATKISANTEVGFSIVAYTGAGGDQTFAHGLSSAPEMVIVKCRSHDTTLWAVIHKDVAASKYLNLATTIKETASESMWNSTYPSSTVVSIGGSSHTSTNGRTYIAYCFHSVEGYSKIGSYTGNGNADGTFVYTGFRPAFVMVKRSSATSDASGWFMVDKARNPFNIVDNKLAANKGDEENDPTFIGTSGANDFDFYSNGFKPRRTNAGTNTDGNTYIYIAFAEMPFKYANGR